MSWYLMVNSLMRFDAKWRPRRDDDGRKMSRELRKARLSKLTSGSRHSSVLISKGPYYDDLENERNDESTRIL